LEEEITILAGEGVILKMFYIPLNQERRKDIDAILNNSKSFEEVIEKLPSDIEFIGYGRSGLDCIFYGLGVSSEEEIHSLAPFERVKNIRKGDVILYLEGKKLDIMHLGRYDKDNMVISQWSRQGHLFRHPIDVAPSIHGDFALVRRSKILNSLETEKVF